MDDQKKSFPAAAAHGPITEVFPDVYQVTGGFRFGPGLSISRNMTLVRQGGELVVLNSVRLSPEGEAQLAKLGEVKHVVRVGFFHGYDDPYYVDRYKAEYWVPPGLKPTAGIAAQREISSASSPLSGATVFSFEGGSEREIAVLLEREGGALVTCDSYQNWTSFADCSLLGGLMMRAMGFGPALIGMPWTKRMGAGVRADFDRLVELPFKHLLPAHGAPLRDAAREGLRKAIAHRFG
jgi:hypothetical protein